MLDPVFLMVTSIIVIFNIVANCFPINLMSTRVYTFRKICYMSIHTYIG